MKIRINDESGTNIGECVINQDEYGNWYVRNKSKSIKNIFADMEQDEELGFIDMIDIDIKTKGDKYERV